MGWVAGAASLAGVAISAVSSEQAGQANKAISKHNAAVGEIQAKDALQRGREQAGFIREVSEELKGSQRAAFATQGVRVGTGSAAIIQAETDYIAELEVNTIQNNAAMEAWGFEVGAETTRAQGRLAAQQGRSQAFGTLLGGAGQVAGMFGS